MDPFNLSTAEPDGVRLRLNGRDVDVACSPTRPLVSMLRDDCHLKGVKLACSRGVCGSCTVLIDGVPGASCALFAFQVDGKEVLTVEGLAALSGTPTHPIQAAFAANAGFQCGYCTPGMILLTKALLDANPDPDRDTVVQWISASICRCTGYQSIIAAVLDAARRLRAADAHG